MEGVESSIDLRFRFYREDGEGNLYCLYPEKEKSLSQDDEELIGLLASWMRGEDPLRFTTSGTTGRPKEIRLSRATIAGSARNTAEAFGIRPGAKALLCLPLRYIAGAMMLLRSVVNGWELYAQRPSGCPQIHRVYDLAAMTPMQVRQVMDSQPGALETIGTLLIGGGVLPKDLEARLATLRYVAVYHTYGMTETATHVAYRRIAPPSIIGDVYTAMPGVRFEQAEDETLIVHADYVPKPVHTKDRVHLLSERQFEWLGRVDRIINTGGIKVQAEYLEDQLSPYIEQPFVVVGRSHPTFGEEVTLVVEGMATPAAVEHIRGAVKEVCSGYTAPRKLIFLDALPRTRSGKIALGAIQIPADVAEFEL